MFMLYCAVYELNFLCLFPKHNKPQILTVSYVCYVWSHNTLSSIFDDKIHQNSGILQKCAYLTDYI